MRVATVSLFVLLSSFYASSVWAAGVGVDGTLYDLPGNPLSNTQVELQNGEGKIVKTAISNAQGHYQFADVSPGIYVMQATQNDSILGSTLLTIANAEDVHKDLKLADSQTLNVIITQRRQEVRNSLSPTTGTNAYKLNQQSIEALPQGADMSFDKILLQAPGVAEDSAASGSLHIRGEHANLQYRINGILLPDGISGFGEMIDSHIIQNATLLDGALPAQYGFRTAGVIDIDTKSGFQNEGTATMMGGSNGTLQPSVNYGGTYGNAD
jgi:hypothetical protein